MIRLDETHNKGMVRIILDSQAGSCGKGKMVGYLAEKYDGPFLAINNFMSNAGHTYVQDNGFAVMTQHLPTSLVNPFADLYIGPGAAITPEILAEEIYKYKDLLGMRKVKIHPRAVVIKEKHRDHEKEVLKSGSTFKGCGASLADKAMRQAQLFGDWFAELENMVKGTSMCYDDSFKLERHQAQALCSFIEVADTAHAVNQALDNGFDVIIEGSQGFDLDVNYGLDYPYTTSRQCHAGQLLADCGISPTYPNIEVMMIMRPYPIRISNSTNLGDERYSGDYSGAEEISWDTVKERCKAPAEVELGEKTTVTKKVRRVFEMNWNRLKDATIINRPTSIVLNFAQYLDYSILGMQGVAPVKFSTLKEAYPDIWNFCIAVNHTSGTKVTHIGTGAKNCEMIEIKY